MLRLGVPVVFVLIWSTGFIVAKAVLKSGKALCAVTPNMASDDAKKMLDLGVTALMVASDQGFIRAGALTHLEHFKKLVQGGAS